MGKHEKLIQKILSGRSDSNIGFDELCKLLVSSGFRERIKGSHHIFTKADILEIVNIQPSGNNAKAYQVKQIRNLLVKYRLEETNADQI